MCPAKPLDCELPCRTSSTCAVSSRYAPACAQSGSVRATRPCRRSRTCTAALRYAPRMCVARWPDIEKALPHVEHSYGRSPLCTRMCTARLLDDENALPHVERSYGRSPVCTRMCTVKWPDDAKAAARRALVPSVSYIFLNSVGPFRMLPLPTYPYPFPNCCGNDPHFRIPQPHALRPVPVLERNSPHHAPVDQPHQSPRYHGSCRTSITAHHAAASKRTGECSLSRPMSSRTSPSSKCTRQRGRSACGIRLTSPPRYYTPSAKRASTPRASRMGGMVDLVGPPPPSQGETVLNAVPSVKRKMICSLYTRRFEASKDDGVSAAQRLGTDSMCCCVWIMLRLGGCTAWHILRPSISLAAGVYVRKARDPENTLSTSGRRSRTSTRRIAVWRRRNSGNDVGLQ